MKTGQENLKPIINPSTKKMPVANIQIAPLNIPKREAFTGSFHIAISPSTALLCKSFAQGFNLSFSVRTRKTSMPMPGSTKGIITPIAGTSVSSSPLRLCAFAWGLL